MKEIIDQKWDQLKKYLEELGSAAVAFSGGVDSAFLLRAAKEALGEHVIAVTADSLLFPKRELQEAEEFVQREGIRHVIFEADELQIRGFCENPPDRCYLCKKDLFQKIKEIAGENGCAYVVEGSNTDDNGDYRPGLKAVEELEIKSPLRETGFSKEEIRLLSKRWGLPTWEKPSFACLASRFVYGEKITEEKLRMVDRAEQFLLERGFRQIRVRIHGNMARVEVMPEDFPRFLEEELRGELVKRFREYGFSYTAIDLQGYRTGSMNEVLQ